MISVIICSRSEADFARVSRNIAETAGIEHEVIRIDNSDGGMGICHAYNQGAESARFPLLCFVHEDVEFRTQAWGRRVAEAFETEPQLGLLGVAGSRVQNRYPSPWCVDRHYSVQYNLQGDPTHRAEPVKYIANIAPGERAEVAVLDGLLLITPRSVWEKVRFDEQTLPGFHAYDLDFSLAVRKAGFKAMVDAGVLVVHYSSGSFNQVWLEASMKLCRKWRASLPASTVPLAWKEEWLLYWRAVFDMLHRFRRMGLSKARGYLVFVQFFDGRYIHFRYLTDILLRLRR